MKKMNILVIYHNYNIDNLEIITIVKTFYKISPVIKPSLQKLSLQHANVQGCNCSCVTQRTY